jgi:putative glutamine amidotransferase
MRPVIGYATRSTTPDDQRTAPRFFQSQSYAQTLAAHGGAPLMIPSLADPDVLDTLYPLLDGLLLPGGPDIDPSYYGDEERHASIEVDASLDTSEAYLLRRALADDLPVLGICRGIQVLNVIAGGTLYQDLPSHWPGATLHNVSEHGRHHTAHGIAVVPATALARILEVPARAPLPVNTLHHQGVRDVAPGFAVSARGDDGLVEGIEDPARTFTLGVQCHPEELYADSPVWSNLFRAFVDAAARRRLARRARARHPVVAQSARP